MTRHTWWAYAATVVLAVLFGYLGTIVGALIGNAIAPANLTWSGASTPGLLFVGALLGLLGGLTGGIWLGVRIVREAKARAASFGLPTMPSAASRRRRRIATVVMLPAAVAGIVAFAAWPRPICTDDERSAIRSIPNYGGVRAPVRDASYGDGTTTTSDGCEIVFSIDAPAADVSAYYAQRLYDQGWRGLDLLEDPSGPVGRYPDDPDRFWISTSSARTGEAAWDDLAFDVYVSDMGGSRVLVQASVTERGNPYG